MATAPKCIVIVLMAPSSQLQMATALSRSEVEELMDGKLGSKEGIVTLPVVNDKAQEGVSKFLAEHMLSYTVVELVSSNRLEVVHSIPPIEMRKH